MNQLTELLTRLCQAPGTSGWEDEAAAVLTEILHTAAPNAEVATDPMGNVTAFLGDRSAPRQILIDAHLDQIGLVVTHITDDGFLKVANVGGMDRRILPCSTVTVCGKKPLLGTVAFLPPHLTKGGEDTYPEWTEYAIDIGKTKEEAEALVSLGDRILVNGPVQPLLGNRVAGAALDDRCGCAALVLCAEALNDKALSCGVTFAFTGREEVGCEGAQTAAYLIDPTEALVVDVTFGDQPDVSKEKTGTLGGGPMIGIAPSLDRSMKNKLIALAKTQDLPYQLEVMGGVTGTNGDTITAEGQAPGTIAFAPMGDNGFGYDPVFFVPDKAKTFAQLTQEEKAEISHRGKALREFTTKLETYLKK